MGSDFTVDVDRELGLVAGSVKALIAQRLFIAEEGSVESAAEGTGDASSGNGVEGRVLAVEGRIRKGEVKVVLNPR